MGPPDVSVIMPVYNGSRYLDQAIRSALAQTHERFELIIVNDCSTDDSDSIIRSHLADPRIVYLCNDANAGVAASRNHALRHARGRYICFHDQDDLWVPEKLALQLDVIEAHPDAGLLHAAYARIDPSGSVFKEDLPQDYGSRDPSAAATVMQADVFSEIFISNDIQPLTTMIRRDILDEVGHFNPDLPGVDDYDLWLRIAYRYPVAHLQVLVGFWRQHERQQSRQGYRMLLAKLNAIDSFLVQHPEARSRVPAAAFRQRMYTMNASAANHHLYVSRDFRTAATHFRKALRYRPLSADALVKLAYCSLPAPLMSIVRRLKNTLTRS